MNEGHRNRRQSNEREKSDTPGYPLFERFIDKLIVENFDRHDENKTKNTLIDERTLRSFYVTSKINAQNNPDILCGSSKYPVLFGNKYHSQVFEFGQEQESGHGEGDDQDDRAEEGKEESEKEDGSESSDEKYENRYFHSPSKSIVCRNCGGIGHIARKCPNEAKVEYCKLCGNKAHENSKTPCPFVLCFKCNKSGHTASECKERNLNICPNCNFLGHNSNQCLVQPYFSVAEDEFIVCYHCGKQGHRNCEKESNDPQAANKIISLIEHDFTIESSIMETILNQCDMKARVLDQNPEESLSDESDIDETTPESTENLLQRYDAKQSNAKTKADEDIGENVTEAHNTSIPDYTSAPCYCESCGKQGHIFGQCRETNVNRHFMKYHQKAQLRQRLNQQKVIQNEQSQRRMVENQAYRENEERGRTSSHTRRRERDSNHPQDRQSSRFDSSHQPERIGHYAPSRPLYISDQPISQQRIGHPPQPMHQGYRLDPNQTWFSEAPPMDNRNQSQMNESGSNRGFRQNQIDPYQMQTNTRDNQMRDTQRQTNRNIEYESLGRREALRQQFIYDQARNNIPQESIYSRSVINRPQLEMERSMQTRFVPTQADIRMASTDARQVHGRSMSSDMRPIVARSNEGTQNTASSSQAHYTAPYSMSDKPWQQETNQQSPQMIPMNRQIHPMHPQMVARPPIMQGMHPQMQAIPPMAGMYQQMPGMHPHMPPMHPQQVFQVQPRSREMSVEERQHYENAQNRRQSSEARRSQPPVKDPRTQKGNY